MRGLTCGPSGQASLVAKLRVLPDQLEVQLSRAEQALALRRQPIQVARELIRSATVTHDPWVWIRGIRAPGTYVPLALAVGTWKNHNGKDFLVVKAGRPAVVLELEVTDAQPWSRLLLSTPHAAELIASLQLEPSSDGTRPKRSSDPD